MIFLHHQPTSRPDRARGIHAGIFNQMTETHRVITIEPGKRGGKPCVRGLRSTVYDVLDPGFRRGDDGWCRSDEG